MTNDLIKKFGKQSRWVTYQIQERKGKKTKVPYSITGRLASSTDEKTWSTYDEVKKKFDDVGIMFTPAQDLLGIDIDHCLKNKKIDHEQREQIAELILEADTYTEISPSGEGLHIFLAIEGGKFNLESNKRAPYEAYTSGRYFTFTGNIYGANKSVRTVSPEEALKILSIIGYPWKKEESTHDTVQSKNVTKSNGSSLSDEEILRKMFKAKGGEKIEALYNGSLADHKNDGSVADMSLCSHLAFWTAKNPAQIERIWLASPLGKRKKTQERKDYRDRTIAAAIASCKSVYETPKMKMERENPDLDLLYVIEEKGRVIYLQNTENMSRILRNHPEFSGRFRYDAFKNVFEIKSGEVWRSFEDNDAVVIQTRISILFSEWFGRVGKDMIYDAMIKVAKENEIDSARDYIKGLVWDKKERLDTWLNTVYGAPIDVYHTAVASNWIKGLVQRIIHPGSKFDYVLVLEGEQGARKSTSLFILGGEWHVETTMSTDSKDFFMQFQGKAIIEFSEGETLSRTEVKRMKAIITMQSDKYRPPYERTSRDFPRRCVFAMTTNQDEYLKDETGNRRWLPVKVVKEQADTDWLSANRDQLLAEAYHRVENLKEKTYEFPREETLAQQNARRISDPNQDIIEEWYYTKVSDSDKEAGITIDRVYKECLCNNFPTRPVNKFEQMSIGAVLKDHLCLIKRQASVGGMRSVRWFNDSGVSMKVEGTPMEEAARDF